jgi:hypothetical protein
MTAFDSSKAQLYLSRKIIEQSTIGGNIPKNYDENELLKKVLNHPESTKNGKSRNIFTNQPKTVQTNDIDWLKEPSLL